MIRPASAFAALLLAGLLVAPAAPASAAQSSRAKLQKEKARLTEIRKQAERAAAELERTIEREKDAKDRVRQLKRKLARQRETIRGLDRRIGNLSRELEAAEAEARALEAARREARAGLAEAARSAYERGPEGAPPRNSPPGIPNPFLAERNRHFLALALGSGSERYGRLTEDRERAVEAVDRLEGQVQVSERRKDREEKVNRGLAGRKQQEERRLAGIEAEKRAKEKRLRELKARVQRMESLVSRIERQIREAEEKARRKARKPPGKPGKASDFAALPGGVVLPVRGGVASPFGRYRDPVFDVEVESRGVEIEAPSGSPVRAIARGKVVFTGEVAGFGNVLILQHGGGLFSVYGKARSYNAPRDRPVGPGEEIGRLPKDPSGRSVLYLELRAGGTAIDPASVLPLGR